MQTLAEILSEPVFVGTAAELTKDDIVEVSLEELLEEFDEEGNLIKKDENGNTT